MIVGATIVGLSPAGGQALSYTGTAGVSNAVAASANFVRLVSTTDCFIEISRNGTAAVANTGAFLPAYLPEYFECPSSGKVSAIQASAAGTLYISYGN